MPDERFLIQIILDAQSKVAPVMKSVSDAADSMAARLKLADQTVRGLDDHLGQLDRQAVKARDTLRSLNPTLESLDRKFKGVSEKTTVINRNFGVLERQSGKLAAGFKTLNTVIDGLERKLNQLDEKMAELGAREAKPKIELDTAAKEAQVDALLLKLQQLERKKTQANIGIDQEILDREIARAETKIKALGGNDILIKYRVAVDDQQKARLDQLAADQTAKLDAINRKAEEAARNRDIKFTIQGEEHIKAQIAELVALADSISKKDVGIKATFNMGSFRRQYAEIQAAIDLLAARSPNVKVKLDVDRPLYDRFLQTIDGITEHADLRFSGLSTRLRDLAIGAAIIFAEPLLSAITALGGALIAVGVAAGQAAIGLAGLATAGIAQALPVVGILVATFSRLAGVMKAVQAAQAEKDKGALQGAKADATQQARADALKNAHQGVADALRNLTLAQENLNEARQQGLRTLVDMRLAEERATLTAQKSRFALAAQIGSGSGGLIQDAQLQSRSDTIQANRQQADTSRAVAGGVDGLPQVQAAARAVDDARRSLARANDAVAQAERQFKNAADTQGAAANALAIALGKLTGAERQLYDSIRRFQSLFQKGGAFSQVTDLMVAAFARGLDKITALLSDPEIIAAATKLSGSMAKAFDSFVDFFTKGPMRTALIFFSDEASKNLQPFVDTIKAIITILKDVGVAASGPFRTALTAVRDFFQGIAKYTSSDSGQASLKKFFTDALAPISSFLKLGGAVLNLFLALVGVNVGKEGTRGIDALTKSINGAADDIRKNGDQVRQFFHDAIDATGAILMLFVKIGAALVDTFDPESVDAFAKTLGDTVLPALVAFVKGIGFVTRLILELVNTPIGSFFAQTGLFMLGAYFAAVRFLGVIKLLRVALVLLRPVLFALAEGNPIAWAVTAIVVIALLLKKFGLLDDVVRAITTPLRLLGDLWEATFGRIVKLIDKVIEKVTGASNVIGTVLKYANPISGPLNAGKSIIGSIFGHNDDDAKEAKKRDDELVAYRDRIAEIQDLASKGIHLNADAKVDTDSLTAISSAFDRLASGTSDSIKNLEANVRLNARLIARTLDVNSAAGKEALSANFAAAIQNVQNSMDAGVISTRNGLREITRLMKRQLALFGIKGAAADNYISNDTGDLSGKGSVGKSGSGQGGATGGIAGWIGNQGERGADAVNAVLGRGEAVLNWAHQRVVEPALNAMYGFGLDGLFKGTRGLHAGTGSAYQNAGFGGATGYAGGGPSAALPSQVSLGGVHPGVISAARRIINMFPGLIVTSGTGGSHATNSFHYRGDALDIGGPGGVMNRAASWIAANIGSRLAEGIHNPGLSIKDGKSVPSGFWGAQTWAGHADHIHIAVMGALGRALGITGGGEGTPTLARVRTRIQGALGAVVQGSLDANRRAAIARLADAAGGGGGAAEGSFSAPGFTGPWVSRMSDIASSQGWNLSDWKTLVQGESSGNPNARNPSSGAYGLGQFLGGTLRAYAKYGATSSNPIRQIEAMAKYIADRYHDPSNALHQWLARSPHWYAGGGRVASKFAGWFANGTDRIVNSPTLFGAGEAGAERVTITPMAAGAPSATGSYRQGNSTRTTLSFGDVSSLLEKALASTGVDSVIGGVQAFIRALRKFNIKTSDGLDKVGKLLDFATTEGTSATDKIVAEVQAKADRRNALGLDPLGTAAGSSSGLRAAQTTLSAETAIARAGLARANRTGNTKQQQLFKGELAKLETARTDLLSKLTDNANNIVNGVLDIYDRIQKNLTRRQDITEAQGKAADPNVIGQQIGFARLEQQTLAFYLAQAKKSKNTQLARSIQDKIDDLDVTIAQLITKRIQTQLDNINDSFDRRNNAVDRNYAIATSFGVRGSNAAKIDQQKALADDQAHALVGVYLQALQSGNTGLADTIRAQIETLNNAVVQFASDRIKAVTDDINTDADRALAHNDVRQRLATLGVTQDQARSGIFDIASLGRTNFGAVGSALQDRGRILNDQRSALIGQLSDASVVGDQSLIADLTKQIEQLDGDVVDNAKAIRDNTDAAFNSAISQSQSGSDFLLSLNQGAQAINTGLGAISGTTDNATTQALLTQRGQELGSASQANRGFLGQLLNGIGVGTGQLSSVSGNDLVPYLTQLYTQGIATGALDDTQIQTMKDLITAIINGETATLDNTKAIKDLNGSVAQTFSSTAWTTFRQAIFNGAGGLLPEYSIPQMHLGGYVTKAGVFDLSVGERVLTPEDQKGSGSGISIGEQNVYVTNPTQTLDERHIGTKIGWSMAGTGRQ